MAYNRVYTKEKWEEVNKYNKNLLDDYMMQIKAEGKTAGSIKQYYNDARILMIFILEELDNKPLYKLNRKSFRNFTLWMQDNNLSSARINRMLSTARNVLNFGLDDDDYSDEFDDCKANPNRIKGMQKKAVREIVFLTDEEVHEIFEKLLEQKRLNEAMLCALMYDSACRRNEAYQVKRNDISLDGHFTDSEVVGKRQKKFKLMYSEMTKRAFSLLEEVRTDDGNYLWLTRAGSSASYESLYAWVVSWRVLIESDKKFNPHSFRHSSLNNYENGTHYVARKLNKKFTINELKLLAHHESIETTSSYLENKDEDLLLQAFGVK